MTEINISISKFDQLATITAWCTINFGWWKDGSWAYYVGTSINFWFQHEKDAVLFALKWK